MRKRFSKKRVDTSNAFAPWITGSQIQAIKDSDAYGAFLKIHEATGLKCVDATEKVGFTDALNKPRVIMGLDNNFRVAALSPTGGGGYRAVLFDSPDCASTSQIGQAEKAMYLANRILNHTAFENAHEKAKDFTSILANKAFFRSRSKVREANNIDYDPTDDIKRDEIAWLLKLHFNAANDVDLPPHTRASIDRAYRAVCTNGVNVEVVRDTMRSMFCREKWVIGYREQVGYWIGLLDMSKTYYKFVDWSYDSTVITENTVDVVRPIKFYPNYESIPSDLIKEIMPSQAMFNMYLDGCSEFTGHLDGAKLIPGMELTSPDANAVAFRYWHNGNMWVVLDKV